MSNQCEYGFSDCVNLNEKCHLCSVRGLHYKQPKVVKTKPLGSNNSKISKRKGAAFEYNNNKANNDLLSGVTSRQTPNSGAGSIKGDTEIMGIINIMEELKEQNKLTSKGLKTFTIQKEWLEKLKREAFEANKEFWYLKFIFNQNDKDVYVILDSDMVMSMVYTMVEDRKSIKKAELDKETYKKETEYYKSLNTELRQKIEWLESQLAYERYKHDSEL